jgi:hypothetical protein
MANWDGDVDHEAMADEADAMRKYRRENPPPPRTEYLTAGMLTEQAEGKLITEWLNELSLSARVTLAARLLNFTYQDLQNENGELGHIAMRLATAAEECARISQRMAMYRRTERTLTPE